MHPQARTKGRRIAHHRLPGSGPGSGPPATTRQTTTIDGTPATAPTRPTTTANTATALPAIRRVLAFGRRRRTFSDRPPHPRRPRSRLRTTVLAQPHPSRAPGHPVGRRHRRSPTHRRCPAQDRPVPAHPYPPAAAARRGRPTSWATTDHHRRRSGRRPHRGRTPRQRHRPDQPRRTATTRRLPLRRQARHRPTRPRPPADHRRWCLAAQPAQPPHRSRGRQHATPAPPDRHPPPAPNPCGSNAASAAEEPSSSLVK